jgi:ubiquinone/menaquinone biosynthesis C-methylase UbiE
MDQRYVIDPTVQVGYVSGRELRTFLPFLVAHLRPGLDVLDVGCGVGSIALDAADTVRPGRVVGVDMDPRQIAIARSAAGARDVPTAEFVVGSVYSLPFADASFDVVYSNAVLVYVQDPLRALAEMRRVMRPGGVAAVSHDDWETLVFSPDLPAVRTAADLLRQTVESEGGNSRHSRHLRGMLLEAGFQRTEGVATAPEVYGTQERTRWFAEFMIGALTAPAMRDSILDAGWATPDDLQAIVEGVRTWGERPDAFAA